MWRLFHRIFGWHYVSVFTDMYENVKRVRQSANGRLYVDWASGVWFLKEDGKVDNGRWEWTPLTWTDNKP